MKRAGLAAVLRRLGSLGKEGFYSGTVAEAIVAEVCQPFSGRFIFLFFLFFR
jgi:gamma-glutamyltranspeptidase